MSQAFNSSRRTPLNVLLIQAKQPLVRVGGKGLQDLREDVFDAAHNSNCRAGVGSVDTYAIAMSGGEPFSVWS